MEELVGDKLVAVLIDGIGVLVVCEVITAEDAAFVVLEPALEVVWDCIAIDVVGVLVVLDVAVDVLLLWGVVAIGVLVVGNDVVDCEIVVGALVLASPVISGVEKWVVGVLGLVDEKVVDCDDVVDVFEPVVLPVLELASSVVVAACDVLGVAVVLVGTLEVLESVLEVAPLVFCVGDVVFVIGDV